METLSSRFKEVLRNLKSDAVPRAPRPENNSTDATQGRDTNDNHGENHDQPLPDDDYEEVVFGEDDFIKDEKKTKFGFPFKSKKDKDPKPNTKEKRESFSSVNTQATGTVFNVVNSNGVQFGSNHVYYLKPNGLPKDRKNNEDHIEKDNLIILLLESKIEPKHKYIDFIAKNLGEDWQSFFVALGYLKGRIQTLVMEKGITEARYHLLLDWVHNEDDATLGRLASILWEEGERQIVKHLSIIYKESKK